MPHFSPQCVNLPWMVDFHATTDKHILTNQLKASFAASSLAQREALSVSSALPRARLTGLACPVPCTATVELLGKLMDSGMDVAVFRMAEYTIPGRIDEILSKLQAVKDQHSIKIGRIFPLAVAFDMQGNMIRTGTLKGNSRELRLAKGDITNLTTDASYENLVDENMIYLDFPQLTEVVKTGDKILLGNESVTLSALDAVENVLRCVVETAGRIISRDVVSVRSSPVQLPQLTDDDVGYLKTAVSKHVDAVFVPNVTTAKSVRVYRSKLETGGNYVLVIVKIENVYAVHNLDEILGECDGVLLDGNRLMVEVGAEKLYVVQRSVTARCARKMKVTLCTIDFAHLRKPDVMEISNTIGDGVDGLYLLRTPDVEGDYFANLLQVRGICIEAEAAFYTKQYYNDLLETLGFPESPHKMIAVAAVQMSLKLNVAAIVVLTTSGRAARLISHLRPRCVVIAVTRCETVAQQLHFFRGVDSLVYVYEPKDEWSLDSEKRLQLGMSYAKHMGYVRAGDAVVLAKGYRAGAGFTNTLRIVYASAHDAQYGCVAKDPNAV